jgi:teichuronic acid exporter
MVDTPIDVPWRSVVAWRPYIEPALRHAGWFAFFLLLAPVVGPRGYGLFVVALSGIAIAEAVLTETATQALANLDTLDGRHLSTVLVSMIVAGAALSLTLHVGGLVAGAMLDDSMLGDIFHSLTLLPLLGALSVVPRAMLRRERRSARFAAANLAGLAAGGGLGLALAWAGAGPWSLVAQIVVQRFLGCALLWGMVGERVGIAWSRRHFAEVFAALDGRALAAAWPAISRHGPCLVVGLSLGPTAAGLYMLAARLVEALVDICLARPASLARDAVGETVRRGCQAMLPALLGSAVLAVAVPPLLDIRWWGAVRPAQILLLGALPAAIMFVRKACAGAGEPGEGRWGAVEAAGGTAVAALAAPHGLSAVAAASLALAAAMACASLWPIRRHLGARWREAAAAAARPCAGSAAATLLLGALAEPVGLVLDPVPALALMTASAWLCYVVIRDGSTRAKGTAPPHSRHLGAKSA